MLLPGVPLALYVKGGVPTFRLLCVTIVLPGLGWFSGRAGGELGEPPLLENWTNFSSGTSESAVMRAATGFLSVSGVLVKELTHDRVGHQLRLIGGSGGRGEGAEDWRKEAGSYETEDTEGARLRVIGRGAGEAGQAGNGGLQWTADAEIQAGWSWRGRQVSERINGSRSHVDATEIISIQVCIHFSVKLFRDSKTINEDRGT